MFYLIMFLITFDQKDNYEDVFRRANCSSSISFCLIKIYTSLSVFILFQYSTALRCNSTNFLLGYAFLYASNNAQNVLFRSVTLFSAIIRRKINRLNAAMLEDHM